MALLVASLGLFCLIFWKILANLTHIWFTSSAYHHGFLVLPLSLWLIWRQWDHGITPTLSFKGLCWGFCISVPFALIMTIGANQDINFLTHIAFTGLFISIIVGIGGKTFAQQHYFALAYLFFMVPVGDILLLPLQTLTAMAISGFFTLFNLSIIREGILLTTSSGQFIVAESCSGMRFLLAATMLTSLYGFLSFSSWHHIALFTTIGAIIAIMINIIRAIAIVFVATLSDMQIGIGVDHLIFGWILYFITFAAIFLVGHKMQLITFSDNPSNRAL